MMKNKEKKVTKFCSNMNTTPTTEQPNLTRITNQPTNRDEEKRTNETEIKPENGAKKMGTKPDIDYG